MFSTSISYNFEPQKADCLNGAEHNWRSSGTFPREFSVMRCSMCDEERKPTDSEMAIIMTT